MHHQETYWGFTKALTLVLKLKAPSPKQIIAAMTIFLYPFPNVANVMIKVSPHEKSEHEYLTFPQTSNI